MRVLGLSAYYHDAAAALVVDGEVVAAAQEERFTRIRHDASFPRHAMRFCLEHAGIEAGALDAVAFYDKPFLKFERLLETYLAFAPAGFTSFRQMLPTWVREKLFQKDLLLHELAQSLGGTAGDWRGRLMFSEHHVSHAASAFYPSPFPDAAILTMDGVGEWTTTSLAVGEGPRLEILREIHFPHSLGLLYSAFTYHAGFKVNSGEYKLMGLAPYGVPRYADRIRDHLIAVKDDGSFRLDLSYFGYCTGLTMTNRRFDDLFGGPPRPPEALLTQREMDLAASIQAVTEDVVLKLASHARRETGRRNLCLAGGVALNCVANGKLQRSGIFDAIWVQPAAGDAGSAIGCALAVHHLQAGKPRTPGPDRDGMRGSFLGPEFAQADIESRLRAVGARFEVMDDEALVACTARALADGEVVGWHQGRMEFGPRALGARSILADPRRPDMQRKLNLKIKFRESFRPFAPAVLAERAGEWFETPSPSPYMLVVSPVHEKHRQAMTAAEEALFGIDKLNVSRSGIPAVTHVDYSARVQTVHRDTNPRFHALISRFEQITGCPVLANTSFNVRGEPIVCSPEDAFACFMGTGIDTLAVGNCLLKKDDQDPALARDYRERFAPD